MLPDQIIEPDSLQIDADRVSVSIRMPWYRALPLSSVADLSLTVDGQPVARESLTWTVNDIAYALDDLPPLHDQWWYVLDSVGISGDRPDGIAASGEHEVQVVLELFIPYITTDFGVLKISETDRKRLQVVA
jgi:hypothetical protein